MDGGIDTRGWRKELYPVRIVYSPHTFCVTDSNLSSPRNQGH
jgi:hypothetical protein